MNPELVRFAYTTQGTFGIFLIEGNPLCYTVELPWLNNAKNISCVPEDSYPLRMRDSGVVTRSTKGEFTRGWEICEVPDRTFIMLHVANHIGHLEGCVGPGDRLGAVGPRFGVWNSRSTFRKLMKALPADEEHIITISFDKEADNENQVPKHTDPFFTDSSLRQQPPG